MRMFWYGELGYPTTEVRDQVHVDFAAAVQGHLDAGTITPATREDAPHIPAGLETGRTVGGLPGIAFGYDIPPGWDNSDGYGTLYSIAQDPSESGGQGMAAGR